MQGIKAIVLVGGMGAGKSTLLQNLQERLGAQVIDRRTIVTEEVLPLYEQYLLEQKGQERSSESKGGEDNGELSVRHHRMNATKWFLSQGNPGLAKIVGEKIRSFDGRMILVDNLRGVDELTHALNHEDYKNVLFVGLSATDAVRIQRIVGRKEAFDALNGDEKEQYLQAKKNVERESQNYNLKETFSLMKGFENIALVLDVDHITAEECLEKASLFLEERGVGFVG